MALQRRYAALDLAERLAQRRAKLGLTQEGAAEKIGVTLRAYQRWELGEAVPRDTNVYKVAKAFGLKASDLIVEPANGKVEARQLDRLEKAVADNSRKLDSVLSLLARRDVEQATEQVPKPTKTPQRRRRKPAAGG